jgi:hypothetical protein
VNTDIHVTKQHVLLSWKQHLMTLCILSYHRQQVGVKGWHGGLPDAASIMLITLAVHGQFKLPYPSPSCQETLETRCYSTSRLTEPHLADIAQFYKRCCQLQLLLRSCLSSCQGPTAQLPQLQGLTVQRLSCWQLLREVAGVTKPAHRSIVGSIQQTHEHNKVVTAFAWCSADAIQVAPVAKCIRPAEVSQASLYMVYVIISAISFAFAVPVTHYTWALSHFCAHKGATGRQLPQQKEPSPDGATGSLTC